MMQMDTTYLLSTIRILSGIPGTMLAVPWKILKGECTKWWLVEKTEK